MSRILVIRLSALGDIAISVPILQALGEQYPDNLFIMLSKPFVSPLFEELPPNVIFKAVEITGKHKGIFGLLRLFREIGNNVDMVCDLHDSLRSHFLCAFFKIHHIPIFRIDKGRKERRRLTRRENKIIAPIKSSFERYKDVFTAADIPIKHFNEHPDLAPSSEHLKEVEIAFFKKENRWIGIAPFARHEGKIYPLDKMEKVIAHFAYNNDFTIFLFGGGKEEFAKIEEWKKQFPSLQISYSLGLKMEVKLMSCLDIMLSMDSANMHLASLARTPVVSVWGATHPYMGFYGLFQDKNRIIQTDLSCRPCSVFGEKPCYRFDYACMCNIDPERIIMKLEKELGL